MPQLHLPAVHTEADLVLAGRIAERMDSRELYVAWTPEHGPALPEVVAELRDAAVGWTGTLELVLHVVSQLWIALIGRGQPPRLAAPAPIAAQPKPAAGEAAA
jgi:hypothetical protein